MKLPWQKRKKRPISRSRSRRESPQLRRQVGIGIILVLLIGILGTGIWYGSRVPGLTIEATEVIGGETIPQVEILIIADEVLSGSYYSLVPRRFAWTYPQDELLKRVAALPRVKNVSVNRVDTKVVVAFEEYLPYALWCMKKSENDCAFIDENGFAYDLAPQLTGAAMVRYTNNEQIATGTMPFTASTISRSDSFIASVARLGLNVILVEEIAPTELAYHVAGGGEIRTSLEYTLDENVKNLATILESDEFSHLTPGSFQYIDLRFGNKVFVNEEVTVREIATTTASSTP